MMSTLDRPIVSQLHADLLRSLGLEYTTTQYAVIVSDEDGEISRVNPGDLTVWIGAYCSGKTSGLKAAKKVYST